MAQAQNRPARKRRTQDERSAETRKKAIEATASIILEGGYGMATTIAIAKRASISRGALQHQFATRFDLLVAVSDRVTSEMLAINEELWVRGALLEDRVDEVIHRYWSAYTSATFFVMLDIYFGTRGEPKLHDSLRRHLTGIDRGSDAPWFALFGDLGLPREMLTALRRHTMATLRGHAVARFLSIEKRPITDELALLASFLLHQLGACKRAPLRSKAETRSTVRR